LPRTAGLWCWGIAAPRLRPPSTQNKAKRTDLESHEFSQTLPEKNFATEKIERRNGSRTRDAGALRIYQPKCRANPSVSASSSETRQIRAKLQIACKLCYSASPLSKIQETRVLARMNRTVKLYCSVKSPSLTHGTREALQNPTWIPKLSESAYERFGANFDMTIRKSLQTRHPPHPRLWGALRHKHSRAYQSRARPMDRADSLTVGLET
jgi:hypothetical protein